MTSTSDGRSNGQTRTYDRADSVVFLKTKEAFGGLSNMAGGFPLEVNGIRILTSEALYQACRFPHLPEVQKLIIDQKSPMTAKMKGKPHRSNSRPDWDQVNVKVMRWCLRVKLAQNWAKFSKLLLETGERPIVEESRRDDFWGAKPIDEQTLVGMNVLGRLLMELREEVKSRDRASLIRVEPLGISDFWLYGQPIQPVEADGIGDVPKTAPRLEEPAPPSAPPAKPVQASLFDQPPPNAKTDPRRKEVQQAAGSMDDLKPYPAMRDSGVPWLGEVPEHWELKRLKARVRNIIEQTKNRDDKDIYVALEHVESWTGRLRTSGPDVTFDSQVKRFRADDVLFGKLRPYLAKVTRPTQDGVCVGEFLVLRPDGLDLHASYLEQFLRSKPIIDAINSSTFGAKMPRADWQFVGSLRVTFPTLPEQTAIVGFLDHVGRRIGRALRAKQKLIALLNEQKQAIIHQAVTRGLDPNVRLKPSGVEWLGDVPEHWEVSRVKAEFHCLNRRRVPLSGTERGAMTSPQYDYYGASGVIDKVDDFLFDDELLLIAEDGANLVLRNLPLAIIARGKFWVNNHAHILKPRRGNLVYLSALMETLNYKPWISGAAQPKLTQDRLMSIAIVVPPRDEQDLIIANVEDETSMLRSAIDRAQREVGLLREYRTRLIADVVTGKLDVREVAAQLPEEVEEPKSLDEADALEEGGEEAAEADLDEAAEEAVA